MSFEEHSDVFLWRCDQCGHEAIFPPNDFWSCVAELKSRRWGFSPPEQGVEGGDTWSHYCGRCRSKHQRTSIMDRTIKSVK
jgi:hypothetical protein